MKGFVVWDLTRSWNSSTVTTNIQNINYSNKNLSNAITTRIRTQHLWEQERIQFNFYSFDSIFISGLTYDLKSCTFNHSLYPFFNKIYEKDLSKYLSKFDFDRIDNTILFKNNIIVNEVIKVKNNFYFDISETNNIDNIVHSSIEVTCTSSRNKLPRFPYFNGNIITIL
jgi:hypothetical protein